MSSPHWTRNHHTLATLALVGATAVWGATFVVVQDAVEQMPVVPFLFWRFAIAALVLFTLGLALVAYTFGFGLNQAQRGAMALGVCSRNGSAMLMAVTAFPVIDPKLMAMSLLTVPLPLIVWLALASFFGSRAGSTAKSGVA